MASKKQERKIKIKVSILIFTGLDLLSEIESTNKRVDKLEKEFQSLFLLD